MYLAICPRCKTEVESNTQFKSNDFLICKHCGKVIATPYKIIGRKK